MQTNSNYFGIDMRVATFNAAAHFSLRLPKLGALQRYGDTMPSSLKNFLLVCLLLMLSACQSKPQVRDGEGVSVSVTRFGGFWSPYTSQTMAVNETGEVDFTYAIDGSGQLSATASAQDLTALKYAIEHADFFGLRDRYHEHRDGCGPLPTDQGSTRISVTIGKRTKTVSIYDGCVSGEGEAKFQIAQIWRLVKTIELFLDQPEWISLREVEWKKRASKRNHR